MIYALEISGHAKKQIRNLPDGIRRRVDARVIQLQRNPRERGTKKLKDTHFYRVRVGDYRILYQIDDSRRLIIRVNSVAHRSEAYGR